MKIILYLQFELFVKNARFLCAVSVVYTVLKKKKLFNIYV